MAVNNNLYPPIINSYMPAFVIGSKKSCRIYFSISAYNSIEDIKNAQVTITNQNTNLSVLNKDKYPCEIMLTNIYEDAARITDDKYYITIQDSDIEEGFEINQYYKVQIRFTGSNAEAISLSTPQAIDSWLTANLSLFSEWSTVCLVRGISYPRLIIDGLDTSADEMVWPSSNVDITGKLTFLDENETETLKSYRINLYDSQDTLLIDSGTLYTSVYSDVNQLKYVLKYALVDGLSYYFTIEYETKNLYHKTETFNFTVTQESEDSLDAEIQAIPDENNGRIKIQIISNNEDNFLGNIVIRRTSNESNFTIWEDIYTQYFDGTSSLNYTWYDYTIKSGMWYKYKVQKKNSAGIRGKSIIIDEPVTALFDDMFLVAEDKQLNIRFNPTISSYKRVVAESKTDTIGSKYPYIRKNGYMNYRQFPIGGLITCLMDGNNLFTNKQELLGEDLSLYDDFNEENRINDLNDWTYEREFREKVLDFLHNDNIKLFKSPTEGNILVKIMNINLTPEVALGRRIYSFTADAYEIDDNTIENISKYNIQSIGELKVPQYEERYENQEQKKRWPGNTEIVDILEELYNQYSQDGYKAKIKDIDYLKIIFEEEPSWIKEDENGPYIADSSEGAIQGYLFYVNNEPFVAGIDGVYEFSGDDVSITSIVFPKNTDATLNYNINILQTEDTSKTPKTTLYYYRVGQLDDVFAVEHDIYQDIVDKYYEDYSTYKQELEELKKVKIEADPGAIVYTKGKDDESFTRNVIDDTGILEYVPAEGAVSGLYIAGIHLEPATAAEIASGNIPINKYYETGETVSEQIISDDIIDNGVYTLYTTYLSIVQKKISGTTAMVGSWNINETEKEWDGSYFLEGVEDKDKRYQAIVDLSELEKGERQYFDEEEYYFFSKEQDDRNGVASASYHIASVENGIWTLDLKRTNYQYHILTLNEVSDKTYELYLSNIVEHPDRKYIWYHDEWWLLDENYELAYSVSALIDYYCKIKKERY